MGDTPLHPPHSQSRPLRKAAGPYPMAWVLLFTAAGVAVARYATLPAGFLAAAFAAATLMAFITYRRRIGNGYIAIALLLLGMALPALRPQPAYGPAGTNRLHEAASERIRRLHLPPDTEAVALAIPWPPLSVVVRPLLEGLLWLQNRLVAEAAALPCAAIDYRMTAAQTAVVYLFFVIFTLVAYRPWRKNR